jgi:hypothetical protein
LLPLYYFRNRDLSPARGRWIEVDPRRFTAGDTDLSRYVGNNPTSATDPLGLIIDGLPRSGGNNKDEDERQGITPGSSGAGAVDNFRKAGEDNNIPPEVIDGILDATRGTPNPWGWDKCKRWVDRVEPKLRERGSPGDIVKGTELHEPKTGIITGGLQVSPWSWEYAPGLRNLWGLIVDSHYAIRVTFPDGQVFYFDNGNWGGIFGNDNIPPWVI